MRKARWFVLFSVMLLWTGLASAQIVITEIMQNPDAVSDGSGEYFEVYNSSGTAVDMNGWTVADLGSNTFTIDNGGPLTVDPYNYFVFGINGDAATNGGVTVNYVYPSTFALGNSDDEIVITDGNGTEIDRVEYDGGTVWPDPTGASMSLCDPTVDNNIGAAWFTSSIPWAVGSDDGSPGAANETPKFASFGNAGVEDWTWRGTSLAPDYWFSATTWLGAANVVQQNVANVHEGTSSVELGFNSQLENSMFYQSLAVTAGASYTFSAWVLENDANLVVTADLYFYNDDGDMLGSSQSAASVDGADWQQLEVTGDTPDGATRVQVGLSYNNSGGTGNETFYADDFVFGEAAPPPPVLTLEQIQTDPQYMDMVVETGGIVTFENGILSSSTSKVYIQDNSGYGVLLFDFDPALLSSLVRGDSVSVTGTVAEFGGILELTSFEYTVISSGNMLPAPIEYASTYDAMMDAAHEGALATITGATLDAPGTGSFNMDIDDGSGTVISRVYSGTGIDLSEAAVGDTLTITGVIGIYSGDVQIYPFEQADVVVGNRNEEPVNWGFEMWNSNASFSWPAYWRISDASMLAVSSSTEHLAEGDSSAMVVLTNGTAYESLAQNIYGLGDAGYYELSVDIFDNDAQGEVMVAAAFYDATGTMIGDELVSDPTTDSADMQTMNVAGYGPEGAEYIQLELRFAPTASYTDGFTCYVDNMVGMYYMTATIADIQTNFDDYDGRDVEITGIITQSSNTTADSFTDAYIQDDSGYGIELYSGTLYTDLVRGAEVRVRGVVDEFRGVTEIVDFDYEILSSDNPLPDPLLASTGDMANNQAYEGTWVEVTGFIQNSVGTPSWTLYLDDGSGTVQVRVWNTTGIDLSGFSRYDGVTVHGVIDLYNGAVQVQPSQQEDIVAATPFTPPTNLTVDQVDDHFELNWTGVEELDETFLYYGVYRNGQLIGTVQAGTSYTDQPLDFGTFSYYVRAYYDVGVSAPSNTVDVDWTHPLWSPSNLETALDTLSGEVTLHWDRGGIFGEGVHELSYDEEAWAGAYYWTGNTMAAHFTTQEPVEVIGLEFFTTIIPGERQFNAEVYEWDAENSQPGATALASVATMGADNAWVLVDINDNPIAFDSDFVVGFGSLDNSVALGYEENVEGWDRTWNLVDGAWQFDTSGDRYGIRVIVRPTEPVGSPVILQPTRGIDFTGTPAEERVSRPVPARELDDLTGFQVMRNDAEIGVTLATTYTDTLPDYGTYNYSVVAQYDEGDSEPATATVDWESNGVAENPWTGIPTEFAISEAYPNPFNPSIHVVLAVPRTGRVTARVFDILGRQVATLTDGLATAGYHRLVWQPNGLPSGMYFLQMQSATGFVATRKITFMK